MLFRSQQGLLIVSFSALLVGNETRVSFEIRHIVLVSLIDHYIQIREAYGT